MSYEGKRRSAESSGLLETSKLVIFFSILSILLRNFSNFLGQKSDTSLYTRWEFVRGERVVDVRTSAVKKNLEFITDIWKYLGLDIYLSLVYVGAKWNHIYQF